MNKRISVGLALTLILVVAALSAFAGGRIVDYKYNEVVGGMPDKIVRYEILDEVDKLIEDNFFTDTDTADVTDSLISSYVEGIGDENLSYLSKKEYDKYKSENNGDMKGIGIKYEKTSKSYIKITRVYPGSPAKQQGLRSGDVIVAFDGIKLTSKNYSDLEGKLNDSTSNVNIIYKRGDTEKSLTLQKGYEAESVSTGVYDGAVGYIQISDFYSGTAHQVAAALDTFIMSGIAALVVDLRDNSSYHYPQAMETLDLFLPMTDDSNPAGKVVDSEGNTVRTYNMTAGEINLPLCVLVSENTSGAAEAFALNMKNMNKGSICGEGKTKGDAMVQQAFELSNDGAVLMVIGKMQSYNSLSYENEGITPDYIVENNDRSEDFTKDKAFLYAASLLTQ